MDENFEKEIIDVEKTELENILKSCMDAPGYILFVGTIVPKDGNLNLDFQYRKYNANIEDVRKIVVEAKKAAINDFLTSDPEFKSI